MAVRPIFLSLSEPPFWDSEDVEFTWFPGFSISQKHKSIESLHEAAVQNFPISLPLEVSSKSQSSLGAKLSAFRLSILHPILGEIPMESAFQGSKLFQDHGQMNDAYSKDPKAAKELARTINKNDQLVGFKWLGQTWPLEPRSWFYDWLYISAVLHSLPGATDRIREFDAFTDIEFNPSKSFNCQARSCAIIASTPNDAVLRELVADPETMIAVEDAEEHHYEQKGLW